MSFSIGTKYRDKVWCDVLAMDVCHRLLGRLWQYDRATIHDGKNTYNFVFDKVKIVLLLKKEVEPKPYKEEGKK
jgi:hypothetical protein